MRTIVHLIQSNKTHYRVKFHQNMISSFQIKSSFVIQKY